jgi:glycerophosphoryl diester phosphodiesterase
MTANIDIQGHRGARGLYPENSLEGFRAALDLGVNTLEMDLCMTKDAYVVISHEPWMNSDICVMNDGTEIFKSEEKNYLLYNMPYEAVRRYDCGSKVYPLFPDQKKIKTFKPTLEEVVLAMDEHATKTGRKMPRYNLEIKRVKGYDQIYHPAYDFFAQAVMHEIEKLGIEDRTTVQSFDIQTLNYLHNLYPRQQLAYLVETEGSADAQILKLNFVPPIYSPAFELLTAEEIKHLKERKIKVIPWTVNEVSDMKKLIEWGVDGMITDYPDRLVDLIR